MKSTKKTQDALRQKNKQIDLIRIECEASGLNIYEVFREAKVPESTVANWNRKNPKPFDTLAKVYEAIENLKKQKNEL